VLLAQKQAPASGPFYRCGGGVSPAKFRVMRVNNVKTFHFPGANDRAVGRAQILLSTVSFGAIGTFAKLGYGAGVDAPQLLALRFLVAAAALWAYFLTFKRGAVRVSVRELAACAALGLAGYSVFATLSFKALESTSATTAGLLFFSYPAFVVALGWLVNRRRPETRILAGGGVTLAGIFIGVFGSLSSATLGAGALFAVGGAVCYAAYVIASGRLLNGTRPDTVALYVTSFAAAGFWLMGGPRAAHLAAVTPAGWAAVLMLALVSTVMALLAFFSGLEKLGSAEASQIGTFELVVSLSLAALVLGEPVGLPIVFGTLFIVTGIVMSQARSRQGESAPGAAGGRPAKRRPITRARQAVACSGGGLLDADKVPCES
jgi:drug/metabolite transporter (DMT)-like permease